jgi:hypothetical protein
MVLEAFAVIGVRDFSGAVSLTGRPGGSAYPVSHAKASSRVLKAGNARRDCAFFHGPNGFLVKPCSGEIGKYQD